MDDDFDIDFDDIESESTVLMKSDFEQFENDEEDTSSGTDGEFCKKEFILEKCLS